MPKRPAWIAATLTLVAMVSATREVRAQTTATVGEAAPEVHVTTTQGTFTLSRQFGVRPTLLEIYAAWCSFCLEEIPQMNHLARVEEENLTIVAVSGNEAQGDGDVGPPESLAHIGRVFAPFDLRYPYAFDAEGVVARDYAITSFPTLVLVGIDGKIQARASELVPFEALRDAVDESLAGQAPNSTFGTAAESAMR